MPTINREAFMLSLGNMWDKWATPESIIKAAKKVGITSEGLNIEYMQQDKFQKASELIEKNKETPTTPSTPDQHSTSSEQQLDISNVSSVIENPLESPVSSRRENSQLFWKEKALAWKTKANSLQSMISELHKKKYRP